MKQYQVQTTHDRLLSPLGQKPMVIGKFVYFAGTEDECKKHVRSVRFCEQQEGTYYKTRSWTIREVSED